MSRINVSSFDALHQDSSFSIEQNHGNYFGKW